MSREADSASIYKKLILQNAPSDINKKLQEKTNLYDPFFILHAHSLASKASPKLTQPIKGQGLSWLAGAAETFFFASSLVSLFKGNLSSTICFGVACYLINEAEKYCRAQLQQEESQLSNTARIVLNVKNFSEANFLFAKDIYKEISKEFEQNKNTAPSRGWF